MNDKKQVLIGSAAALLTAVVLLLTVILPAEYGWDPLGAGAALGLGDLAPDDPTLVTQDADVVHDEIDFQLAPFESVEYKYHLLTGQGFIFEWSAEEKVVSEMHSEPTLSAPGYAVTYRLLEAPSSNGQYRASFDGIHGWYWQNRSQQKITVRLRTTGFFDHAIEFRDGMERRYDF